MADSFTQKKRSAIMAAVRSSGNRSTEQNFVKLLARIGAHGWRRNYPLYGRPDFVFPKLRLAVFVDGCFWHGCREHHRRPTSNRKYWTRKIARNQARDRQTTTLLRTRGWVVLRVWEHELRQENQSALVRRLSRYLGIQDAG